MEDLLKKLSEEGVTITLDVVGKITINASTEPSVDPPDPPVDPPDPPVDPPTEPVAEEDFEGYNAGDNLSTDPQGPLNFKWWTINPPRIKVTDKISNGGTKSLQFEWGASGEEGDCWTELRFRWDDGKTLQVDGLWEQFDIYFPDGTESPSLGPWFRHRQPISGSNNWKWWNIGYEYGNGQKIGVDWWTTASRNGGNKSIVKGDFEGYFTSNPRDPEGDRDKEFLGGLNDDPYPGEMSRGKWHTVKIYVRGATGQYTEDGCMYMWIDDVLHVYMPSCSFYSLNEGDGGNGSTHWKFGMLSGWNNAGADETMYYFVDNFKLWKDKPAGWELLPSYPS